MLLDKNELKRLEQDAGKKGSPKPGIYLPYTCEICGINKKKGNHTKCQKIKQNMHLNHNISVDRL